MDKDKLKATILVEPVPKARPQAARLPGGRVLMYTPAKTKSAEAAIRESVIAQTEGIFQRDVPLYMEVTFYRPRPKSLSKRVTMPVKRPDLDNYWKTVMDALEKFAYEADSQVTTAKLKKRFGSPPRIELVITEDVVDMADAEKEET